ncbi:DUF6790 family protein [Rhodopseudomonas palustris]|uniref:DUF6790 family protein n=1 Tax=Rhodopseudomonas palustris TaxID=1076 RepID=UPI001F31E450|nr:DUF6790 family protein [Rhodopseudomonas palustris]
MAEVIKATIVFVLSNFSLSFLVAGLLFALVAIARAPRPLRSPEVIDKLLAWHVFWSIGVCYFYNFVMHGFFGKMSAAFIGWADSPFQFEVATASLGFSVVGFLAAFRSFDLRLAAILGASVFSLGAAAGHIYQMATQHNFAAGNAGVVFYTDIGIPVFGGVLLWLWWRGRNERAREVPFADALLAMPQDDGEFSRQPVRTRDLDL